MIYLFDEKKDRRRDYGWSDEIVCNYKDILKCFDSYSFLDDESQLRGSCDIVLIHESFFNSAPYEKKEKAISISERMENACNRGLLKEVIFAGSKQSRKITEKQAYMPVSVLYQNLDYFIEKYRERKWSLEDIVYGRNSSLERAILDSIEDANSQMLRDDELFHWQEVGRPRTLLMHTGDENRLDPPSFFKTDMSSLRYSMEGTDPISDAYLDGIVKREVDNSQYDKIFIPLCFGPTLSDYNGLRLALHIRTTEGKNQFSPIYIYSPVNVSDLINDEYFDILKTSNVFLINYSCQSLYDSLLQSDNTNEEDVRRSLSKIHLQPPKNYADGHSIANEWAIYRWSQILGKNIQNEEITKITEKIDYNLYYKYLKTIYPPQNAEQLSELDLNIKGITKEMTGEYLDEPSMLFVDDEAERGWYELFKSIIHKNNPNLFLDYLGKNKFVDKSPEEIVDIICDKVIKDDINIVILDFRLHQDDFKTKNVEDVTGYKALCKIKKINSGIQVIILSATNKVWNLQELQKKDANGFILKESPYNSKDNSFTAKTIESFINTLSAAIKNRFNKELYDICSNIVNNLNKCDSSSEDYNKMIKVFRKQIETLKGNVNILDYRRESSIDIAYIGCFSILEEIKKEYCENGELYLVKENGDAHYEFLNKVCKKAIFHAIGSLLFYLEKNVRERDSLIKELSNLIGFRDAFIHGIPKRKDHFTVDELRRILSFCQKLSEKLKPW